MFIVIQHLAKRRQQAATILVFLISVLSLALTGCALREPLGDREAATAKYIQRELARDDGGVMTFRAMNKPTFEGGSVTQHDVLAETMGLALQYYERRERKKEFYRAWEFTRDYMVSSWGLVSWKVDVRDGKAAASSAAIDDMRIIRGLLLASERWKDADLRDWALRIGNAILKYEVVEDHIVDITSWDTSGVSHSWTVDLSYLDLYTMRRLAEYNDQWIPIYQKSRTLLEESMSQHGLFFDKFGLNGKGYFNVENNLINKLLCAIHLAEVNYLNDDIMGFIEQQIEKSGALFGRYDSESGEATVPFSSVAVYALALRFAAYYENEALAYRLLVLLDSFRHEDLYSSLRGCFGATNCHAFDNFQVLIALLELPPQWLISTGQ